MTNTTPSLRGNGIEITMCRVKIDAQMDEQCLFDRLRDLFGDCNFVERNGRFGYKYTADITAKNGNAIGLAYWGHQHPSATPCVQLSSTALELKTLRDVQEVLPHTVTALRISQRISYISFQTLQQLSGTAIEHPQGAVRRCVEIKKDLNGVAITLERDSCKITLSTDSHELNNSMVTLTVNPPSEFRDMLTSIPIRGAWSCSYWTRSLFDLIFRQGDPLSPEYAGLFSETLQLPVGGSLHM
jgi:hypothetical protein